MIRLSFRAMASPVHLHAAAQDPRAAAAARRARAVFAAVEAAASRFRPSSPWVRLMRAPGTWQTVPRLLAELADLADMWRRATGGLFDPRILPQLIRAGYPGAPLPAELPAESPPDPWWEVAPHAQPQLCRMRLWWPADLGGIGKGFACDRAAAAIQPLLTDFALDAGGDVALRGRGDGPGGTWTTGIEDPLSRATVLACFDAVAPCAVATSAARRSGPSADPSLRHLIDPRSGEPVASGIAAVTVVGDGVVTAEVTAKTLLIAGPPALAATEDWPRPVWWVGGTGEVSGNRAGRAAIRSGAPPRHADKPMPTEAWIR